MAKSGVAEYTPLILGGAALYILYKSDFFRGVGRISEETGAVVGGVATGVQGLGGGVATAATGLGSGISEVARDIAQTTSNFADFLNPLGEMGRITAAQMQLQEQINEAKKLRAAKQEATISEDAFKVAKPELVNITAISKVHTASEKSLRQQLVQDELTQWTYRATRADDAIIKFVKQVASVTTAPYITVGAAIDKSLRGLGSTVSIQTPPLVSGGGSSKTLKDTTPSSASSVVANITAIEQAAAAARAQYGSGTGGSDTLKVSITQPKSLLSKAVSNVKQAISKFLKR
jgi:hypothetical protein